MASKKTSPEREALIEEVLQQYRRQLEEQLPHGTATLNEIEAVAGRIGRTAAADIKQRMKATKTMPEDE